MALQQRGKASLLSGITKRLDFTAGNISGRHVGPESVSYGQLSPAWRDSLRDMLAEFPAYVVYSYETPIAWYWMDGWIVPPTTYSPTTTNHQNNVKVILAMSGANVVVGV